MKNESPRCVALVTPAWPPAAMPNGIVTYTAQIAAALKTRGVRPILLTWKLGTNSVAPSDQLATQTQHELIPVAEFKPSRGLVQKVVNRARRTLRLPHFGQAADMLERAVLAAIDRFPIELIEMEEAFGLSARIAALRCVPVVTRLHGPWFLNGDVLGVPKDKAFRQRVLREREAIANSPGVSAPSRDVLERTRTYYGLELKSARVIPYPLATLAIDSLWNLPRCDQDRIAFIGRFDLHKGGDLMIDAFVVLASRRPTLALDFVGPDRGIVDSQGNRIHLSDYLERKGVPAGIRTRIAIHGQQPPEALVEFRRRALVTVVPSRYETFGYTAIEAMSAGCPLVAANSGGLSEIVEHERTGLLFRPGDAADLAIQIDRLCDAPEWAARLGEAARLAVGQRYKPSAIAEQTQDFYAWVVREYSDSRRSCRAPSKPIA